MAQSLRVFQPGIALGTTATVLYTQGANSTGQVIRAVATNINVTTARQCTFYRVASGGAASAANSIVLGNGGKIMSGQDMILNSLAGMVLNPGDSLQGLSDVAAEVNVFISGIVT